MVLRSCEKSDKAEEKTGRTRSYNRRIFVFLLLFAASLFMLILQNRTAYGLFKPQLDNHIIYVPKELNRKIKEPRIEVLQPKVDVTMVVESVVELPDDEILVLVKSSIARPMKKQDFRCTYNDKHSAEIRGMDFLSSNLIAVRCDNHGVQSTSSVSLSTKDHTLISAAKEEAVLKWDFMVFDALSTTEHVVVLAKGVSTKQIDPKSLRCVFFGDEEIFETLVSSAVHEVFKCSHPAEKSREKFLGKKISLKYVNNQEYVPSVARYVKMIGTMKTAAKRKKKKKICACTMMFNSAKFLKEWTKYHSHLGVDKFIVYDNNSDDELAETAYELTSKGLNIERRSWPWIKAQEAGFTRCAIESESECEWMAFIDVDEFLFPDAWMHQHDKSSSILGQLIDDTVTAAKRSGKQVGQISLGCRNFGPSGQIKNPVNGVTQGYTCRMKKEERHKSIVLLRAVTQRFSSMTNVVHHFDLVKNGGMETVWISSSKGVVNHYKFQAWDEFKRKFKRRVSARVSDWKEDKNMQSKDRTPGLGTKVDKPKDWEKRFCEVEDTSLKDYIIDKRIL